MNSNVLGHVYSAFDSSASTWYHTAYQGTGTPTYTQNSYSSGLYVGGGTGFYLTTTVQGGVGTISGEWLQVKMSKAMRLTKYGILQRSGLD